MLFLSDLDQRSADESTLEPMLRRLKYWHALDDADCQALLTLPHRIKRVEPHAYLVREFDRPAHSCLLLNGFAMRHKMVAGGHRQILAIHMKGELVDLQNSFLGQADHSVQMLTAGKVALLAKADVEKLAFDRPAIGLAMWIDTLVDASIGREWIANIGRRDAFSRIAHLFCEFALRLKVSGLAEPNLYELPMTQDQIADAVGLTPVHINRTIKALEVQGLIERTHPRVITITNWLKLAEAGDFNSAYLHLAEEDGFVLA